MFSSLCGKAVKVGLASTQGQRITGGWRGKKEGQKINNSGDSIIELMSIVPKKHV